MPESALPSSGPSCADHLGTPQVGRAGSRRAHRHHRAGGRAAGDSKLDQVIAADVVKCGVRDDLPGFTRSTNPAITSGFDADFCRVLAAAVLGDSTKVEFVDLETGDARFTGAAVG